MKTTFKEMPVFEVSEELAETLKLYKNQISEKGYRDFSESEKSELIRIYNNCDDDENGVDRSLYSIVAYLLSTQNYTVKEKLYRVILQDDPGEYFRYYFLDKNGKINNTDLISDIPTFEESEVPEQFKAFMKEF